MVSTQVHKLSYRVFALVILEGVLEVHLGGGGPSFKYKCREGKHGERGVTQRTRKRGRDWRMLPGVQQVSQAGRERHGRAFFNLPREEGTVS